MELNFPRGFSEPNGQAATGAVNDYLDIRLPKQSYTGLKAVQNRSQYLPMCQATPNILVHCSSQMYIQFQS